MRKHLNCNWITATNWQQLIKKLNTKPDLIGLNFEILTDGDFLGNLTALRVLLESKGLDTPIGIGITPSTTQETVDMLRNLGILGFGPDWGDHGYFIMPFDYYTKYTMDNWIFDIELI